MTDLLKKAKRYLAGGQFEEARALLKELLVNNPSDARLQYHMGLAQLRLHNVPESLAYLRYAADNLPEKPHIQAQYALALAKSGENELARKELIVACETNCADRVLMVSLCNALRQVGAVADAIRQLPDDDAKLPFAARMKSLEVLAATGMRNAETQGKISARIAQIYQYGEKNARQWRRLALFAAQQDEFAIAAAAMGRYFSEEVVEEADFIAFIEILIMAHELEKVGSRLDEAFERGFNSTRLVLLAAKHANYMREPLQAKKFVITILERDGRRGEAWQLFAELATVQELEQRVSDCEKTTADATGPDRISSMYALGEIRDRLKNYSQAFAAFQEANLLQLQAREKSGLMYSADKQELMLASVKKLVARRVPEAISKSSNANEPKVPVFIVGMPRSGTSLMERVLGSLPDVTMGGESKALGQVTQQYIANISGGGLPQPEDLTASDWRKLRHQYWEMSSASGRFLTDKMPTNFWCIGMALSMFPEASVVYLKRDLKDVCWSIYRRSFQTDGSLYSCDFGSLVHACAMSEAMMNHWISLAPSRILTVCYEAFVRSPQSESRRVADFCGMAWNSECLESHKLKAPTFTFSEQQVRKPISTKGIGKWRSYEAHLGPLMAALARFDMA